ncbi:twin-arginine translocase subunit TatC [Corynebacterium yudongzhengii]|uniref:Sec-independent protein translocase protein TatC n=2 Tax=Corynebacterium yudongzhengii TaxID=2080740 RepID=A0A2U1T8I9_9CORY|nr:twin-arginine translocase subunit TatC [Corynebacterium yudongzhengii]PWC02299.1 twin-arginine translocase subunit TatC [Corynebacterium yudongzhengii]
MTLVEHLKELRRRVIIAVLAMIAGTVIGFIWYQHSPPGVMTLGEIVRGPYCSLPPEYRADFTDSGECRLLATGPFEMFLLRLKVGFLAGLVISSPMWLYQIWAFITPGLHKGERRSTLLFVTSAVTLFVAGALLAYFIVDIGLEFLLGIGRDTQIAALTGQSYYNFVLALIVIFGVSFEVPLIIAMLNIAGLLEYNQVKDKRRLIWVLLFIFAAVLTPGQEPVSMVILALSMCVLVELAFQFCRFNDRRRGIDNESFDDLDDEEASQLDYQPEPVAAATGIDEQPAPRSTPVKNRPPAGDFDDVL